MQQQQQNNLKGGFYASSAPASSLPGIGAQIGNGVPIGGH